MNPNDNPHAPAIAALRELADMLEERPDLPVVDSITANAYPDTAEALFDAAEQFGITVKCTREGHLDAKHTIGARTPNTVYRLWWSHSTPATYEGPVTREQAITADGGSVTA